MGKRQSDYRKPPYAVASIDSALRALHVLRDSGAVRITDLAGLLGISPSTAHRILAMLVYQGFAVQDDRQRYLAGPALCAPVVVSQRNQDLARIARPILMSLHDETGETVNLAVRIGTHARVLMTLGEDPDALGDRSGHVYPAHASSAGRALLAIETDHLVERLYLARSARSNDVALDEAEYAGLLAQLRITRLRGFAVCDEEVQRSISSVAVPVVPESSPACAIVVLMLAGRLRSYINSPDALAPLFAAQQELLIALDR